MPTLVLNDGTIRITIVTGKNITQLDLGAVTFYYILQRLNEVFPIDTIDFSKTDGTFTYSMICIQGRGYSETLTYGSGIVLVSDVSTTGGFPTDTLDKIIDVRSMMLNLVNTVSLSHCEVKRLH